MTSEEVVQAYVNRVREVNPLVNAVVEDRFNDALEEARRADKFAATTQMMVLMRDFPLLGVPFTVKESCSVKGTFYHEKLIANLIL